eukprot:m51a1_g5897 putative structural maintenance of chromosomes protein 3 (1130) ;mRNA; r:543988-549516
MVYIKKILLQGFKSYKDQSSFHPFHPHYNVIVGRNGSGKSNFFDAIRFALCDEKFANLRTSDRNGLLHASDGETSMSAFVEITFDNSDDRFPTEAKEVVLRRTVGMKKDEYYLDRKHVTKSEVMNFLESAGFSRSNPYYIVQQGRINALAMMRDQDRLELLREVAGTRVYDDRRAESCKLLADTSLRIAQADEVLGYIAQRLDELDAEQRELRAYEALDARRRAIEHAAHTREAADCDARLADAEAERERLSAAATEAHAELAGVEDAAKECERALKAHAHEAAALAREREAIDDSRQALAELAELKGRRDALLDAKREQQRRDADADAALSSTRAELAKHERALEATMGRDVLQGVEAIRRIVTDKGVQGVYGPVIENFESDAELSTAIEVTAGNGLFHVIVDTDDTAARLLEELSRQQQRGRVSIIPLNRIAGVEGAPALPETADAWPLLRKIRYEPALRRAFEHMFGKTLLCRSQEAAQAYSKTHNCNCVTPEGDQVNRKGVWTGGFHDARRSRLDAMRAIRESRARVEAAAADARKARHSVQELEARIAQALGEAHKKEMLHQQARDAYEQIVADVHRLERERAAHSQLLEGQQRALREMRAAVEALEAEERALRAELGTELLSQLSAAEQAELQGLTAEVSAMRTQLVQLSAERAQVEAQRAALQNRLGTDLLKRQAELREQLSAIEVAAPPGARQAELEEADRAVQDAAQRAREVEQAMDARAASVRELRERAEKLRADEASAQAKAGEAARALEALLNRRGALLQKRAEKAQALQAMGPLAEAAQTAELRGMGLRELMRALHEVNEELRGYARVNKKAGDQYRSFTEQRAQLQQRRGELDEGRASIDELIAQLDQKKDEAITRTFRGVAKNFQEVFEELVPGGRASLVMQHRAAGEDAAAAEASQSQSQSQGSQAQALSLEQFVGVGVKVTFPGTSEARLMSQLSGGQKSVVALALIFAIQRTDPAPFYLFDEIDANLDATHREAVARMLQKQGADRANSAQFLVATFKPELVSGARQWYGIRCRDRVSSIEPIACDEALAVIRDDDPALVDKRDRDDADADADAGEQKDKEEEEKEETLILHRRKKLRHEEEEEEEAEGEDEGEQKPAEEEEEEASDGADE